ncbi:MAG: sulfatase-like hydrolase/transferase [Desulfobacteraceae bacterium]|jgi:lipoteichoic acid synthase|nr:sulfatase-like hydrolase/transferase [Desulfobacteraceae bacterium]
MLFFIMIFSHILSPFYDLRIEILSLALLLTLFFVVSTWISNKVFRSVTSGLFALFVSLELVSIYFVKTFIGYEFYVHLNLRDIMGMMEIYVVQIFLLMLTALLLWGLFYYAPFIWRMLAYILGKKVRLVPQNKKSANLVKGIVIIVAIGGMSVQGGLINSGIGFLSTMNYEEKSFQKALLDLGMNDYVTPKELVAEKGKNIIVISLESYERGYLSEEMGHLTPRLRALKDKWNYYEMTQNEGSQWTSGSLYASLTGLPAYFGVEGNSIFQNSFHTQITGVSHVLKQAGYHLKYIASKAAYSGTQEILHTFKFDEIIDRDLIGRPCRDKDVFEQAKLEVKASAEKAEPFAIFISTLDTHFPNGIYDSRMEAFVSPQSTKMEFMISAVDYLLGDFVGYLKEEKLLDNTVVYIYPDHLKMGMTSELREVGNRGLFMLTNASENSLSEICGYFGLTVPGISVKMCQSERWCNSTKKMLFCFQNISS